jgi:hypothetical protein
MAQAGASVVIGEKEPLVARLSMTSIMSSAMTRKRN